MGYTDPKDIYMLTLNDTNITGVDYRLIGDNRGRGRYRKGGGGPVGQDTSPSTHPFFIIRGTPKLKKEGENVMRVHECITF